MWNFAAYCETPFCGLPDETFEPNAFEVFVASALQSRILIEVGARSLSAAPSTQIVPDPYCSYAFCDIPGASIPTLTKTFFFSNGKFAGRPDDRLRANRRYLPRVQNSADIERSLPQSPDDQAGELSIGSIDLANNDGALDFLPSDWTIADCPITIRIVPAGGYVSDGQIVGVFFGDNIEQTLDKLTLRLKSVTDYLGKPFYSGRYSGEGGLSGDSSVANQVRPAAYGECFNVTPTLIDQSIWLYQVHDGRILNVDTVREAGLDFINAGNVSSYQALIAAEIPSGSYVTCNDLGVFRAGFSGSPAGIITCDVRGDTDVNGIFSARLGTVLLRIISNRVGLGDEYINKAAFGQLPTAPVTLFINEEKTCAEVFQDMLGGIFGWYAPDRRNFLTVGFLKPPEDVVASRVIATKTALDLEELNITWVPRYEQPVAYNRNWTVMTDDDLSDLVGAVATTATRAQLTSNGSTTTVRATAVKLRRIDAVPGDTIQSPFYGDGAAAAATEVARRVMSIMREGRHMYRVKTFRESYLLNQQDGLTLQNQRFRLADGKPAIVIALRDSGEGEGGLVTVLC